MRFKKFQNDEIAVTESELLQLTQDIEDRHVDTFPKMNQRECNPLP